MIYVSHEKKSMSVAFLKVILKDLFILMDRDCLLDNINIPMISSKLSEAM